MMFQQTQSLNNSPGQSPKSRYVKELIKNPSAGALSSDEMADYEFPSLDQFMNSAEKKSNSNPLTRESSSTGYSSDEGNNTSNSGSRAMLNASPLNSSASNDENVKVSNFVNELTNNMHALDLSSSGNGMGSDVESTNEQQQDSVFSKQFPSPGTFSFGPTHQTPVQESELPQVSDVTQIFDTKHVFESLSNETLNRPFLRSHAASPVR